LWESFVVTRWEKYRSKAKGSQNDKAALAGGLQ